MDSPSRVDRREATDRGRRTLAPGQAHAFHRHPAQEEVIYVLSGTVEQWVDRDMRVLGPGDACFIPAGMVHASFHAGDGDARILAIFGPSVGSGIRHDRDVRRGALEHPPPGRRPGLTGPRLRFSPAHTTGIRMHALCIMCASKVAP